METAPLSADDEALIERVAETNERTVDPEFFDGAHIVNAGVRTTDGSVYEGGERWFKSRLASSSLHHRADSTMF